MRRLTGQVQEWYWIPPSRSGWKREVRQSGGLQASALLPGAQQLAQLCLHGCQLSQTFFNLTDASLNTAFQGAAVAVTGAPHIENPFELRKGHIHGS